MTALAVAPTVAEPMVRVVVMMGHTPIAEWEGPASGAPAIEAGWSRRFGIAPTLTEIPDPVLACGNDW